MDKLGVNISKMSHGLYRVWKIVRFRVNINKHGKFCAQLSVCELKKVPRPFQIPSNLVSILSATELDSQNQDGLLKRRHYSNKQWYQGTLNRTTLRLRQEGPEQMDTAGHCVGDVKNIYFKKPTSLMTSESTF